MMDINNFEKQVSTWFKANTDLPIFWQDFGRSKTPERPFLLLSHLAFSGRGNFADNQIYNEEGSITRGDRLITVNIQTFGDLRTQPYDLLQKTVLVRGKLDTRSFNQEFFPKGIARQTLGPITNLSNTDGPRFSFDATFRLYEETRETFDYIEKVKSNIEGL